MELQDRGNVSLRFNLNASVILWRKKGKRGERCRYEMIGFYILLMLRIYPFDINY